MGEGTGECFYRDKEQAFRTSSLVLAVGRLVLFSDTSTAGCGSSLWQYQEGKPRLIGFASKTLLEACEHYSVTELEMTGLLVNMGLWKNILHHREFDAAVDHVAVTQILKAKTEPATNRIMRLLDRLSAYSFNLYYVKGKDMIIADYLSHNRDQDEDDPEELIPISFFQFETCDMDVNVLCAELEETYYIGTRSTTRAAGETLTPVHGIHKTLDPTRKPEHEKKVPGTSVRKLTPISHSGSDTSLDVQGSKTPGMIK